MTRIMNPGTLWNVLLNNHLERKFASIICLPPAHTATSWKLFRECYNYPFRLVRLLPDFYPYRRAAERMIHFIDAPKTNPFTFMPASSHAKRRTLPRAMPREGPNMTPAIRCRLHHVSTTFIMKRTGAVYTFWVGLWKQDAPASPQVQNK